MTRALALQIALLFVLSGASRSWAQEQAPVVQPVASVSKVPAVPRGGASLPPADPYSVYNQEFSHESSQIRALVEKNQDQFSELPSEKLLEAHQKVVLDWQGTEHVDLECPDERTSHTETRRPFCLRADGKTVIVSWTYYESTKKDDRERLALVAGVLLLVVDVRGQSNRAIALRIADIAIKAGYKPGSALALPPNEDPLHGMNRFNLGLAPGVAHESGAGAGAYVGGSLDWQGVMRGRGIGGAMTDFFGSLHLKGGMADGSGVFNVDLQGAASIWPVLAGVWLAIKYDQFQTYREGFFAVGLPILSIPVQLGGEDYLLIRANGGLLPMYSVGNGSKSGTPNFSEQAILFSGATFNAELVLKTGSFFINLFGEYTDLKDGNTYEGKKDLGYTRLEFGGSIAKRVDLLFKNTEIKLEGRHYQLKADDRGIPGVDLNANRIGLGYEVVF